jgi:hypothetical protein
MSKPVAFSNQSNSKLSGSMVLSWTRISNHWGTICSELNNNFCIKFLLLITCYQPSIPQKSLHFLSLMNITQQKRKDHSAKKKEKNNKEGGNE